MMVRVGEALPIVYAGWMNSNIEDATRHLLTALAEWGQATPTSMCDCIGSCHHRLGLFKWGTRAEYASLLPDSSSTSFGKTLVDYKFGDTPRVLVAKLRLFRKGIAELDT
jgi:hypothetical protein